MSDVVIRAEGLGKKYLIGHNATAERNGTFRDSLVRTARGLARSASDLARGRQLVAGEEIEEFWALKDVSFEIKRGDVVGIIGRNGAGKSTLLKILSRITEPTTGRVEIRGRVASLLEVGTGFHPELSGRENIFLNGAILGMSRREIKRKFDEIVAFAEIEKFLDTPVKRYSSGMYVRLAFAVAAHLEPEILVVDEVLAVGDAEFQKKCLGKMQDVAGHGRTVLFVSHNMGAITQLCSSSLFLSWGGISAVGATRAVVAKYVEMFAQNAVFRAKAAKDAELAVTFAHANTTEQDGAGVILFLELEVVASVAMRGCLEIRIKDAIGSPIGFASVGEHGDDTIQFQCGTNNITVEVVLGQLADGGYTVSLDLTIPNVRYIQCYNDSLTLNITRTKAGPNTRLIKQSSGFGYLSFPARLAS